MTVIVQLIRKDPSTVCRCGDQGQAVEVTDGVPGRCFCGECLTAYAKECAREQRSFRAFTRDRG